MKTFLDREHFFMSWTTLNLQTIFNTHIFYQLVNINQEYFVMFINIFIRCRKTRTIFRICNIFNIKNRSKNAAQNLTEKEHWHIALLVFYLFFLYFLFLLFFIFLFRNFEKNLVDRVPQKSSLYIDKMFTIYYKSSLCIIKCSSYIKIILMIYYKHVRCVFKTCSVYIRKFNWKTEFVFSKWSSHIPKMIIVY